MQSVDENRSNRELCVYCSDAENKYGFILQVTLFNMYFRNLSCLMFPLLCFFMSSILSSQLDAFSWLLHQFMCIFVLIHVYINFMITYRYMIYIYAYTYISHIYITNIFFQDEWKLYILQRQMILSRSKKLKLYIQPRFI